MKKLLLLVLLFQSFLSFSQTIQQIDSVTIKMCESLVSLKTETTAEARASHIFQKHLPEFYRKLQVSSQRQADSITDKIYYRLQKNCKPFSLLLSELEENKSDWKNLDEKPTLKAEQKECKNILKGGKFYYKEHNGNIVNVTITATTWEESFEDNTFSKLKLYPKDNCEFEIEFIESNNEMRKNLSVKGDIYHYGIYAIKDGVLELWSRNVVDNSYTAFKLYPRK